MMWKIQQANQDDAIRAAKFTLLSSFNPLSPNIHIQIFQTDLYIFP